MAKSDNEGNLLHVGSVRFRVIGNGFLQLYLRSLQDVHNVDLKPIMMTGITNKEPLALSNFIDQRIQLEVKTTEINEYFSISKIVIYTRPIYTSYPQ